MSIPFLGVWLILPLSVIVYFFGKQIHRNEYKYYFAGLTISLLLSIGVLLNLDMWILEELVINGHVSFSLFVIVMFGGAFPFGSKPKKYLMQIRREFALIGFLLLIPHGVYRLSLALNGYNFTGLLAFLIMIPLVTVSYPKVRKKIKAITWTNVHKMAYLVYVFIYIHVGFDLLLIEGSLRNFSLDFKAWPYHLVFLIYATLKIRVVIINQMKKANMT